jgi:Tfp pilus assembly protein PilF
MLPARILFRREANHLAEFTIFAISDVRLPLAYLRRGEATKARKKLERVKGIEPSSSAWKIVSKLNDLKGPCVK